MSNVLVIIPFVLLLTVGIRLTAYASLTKEALAAVALFIFASLIAMLVLFIRQLLIMGKQKNVKELLNALLLFVSIINIVYWQWCYFV